MSAPQSAAQRGDGERSEARLCLERHDPPEDLPDPQLSKNARAVLERRYLMELDGERETPRQLFWRVARHVALSELAYGHDCFPEALETARESYQLMAEGRFLPNSPTLTNAGRASGMLSACFVLPIEDSIDGIFESIKATALIQKAGGGTGFSFSRLRPSGDVAGQQTTEGPLSFMEVFSKASASIRQGAFRKGANMGVLRIDHPEIVGFIQAKDDRSRLTNFNLSVGITDEFLERLQADPDQPHQVRNPRTKSVSDLVIDDGRVVSVGALWRRIVEHAHASGEPGLIFLDRINRADPIQNVGTIEATNPCGEQPLHAYDSCNLGSLNVARFIVEDEGGDPVLDETGWRQAVRTATRFLDNVIEGNRYPLPQIEIMSRRTRRIGLGVMGYADALYRMGFAYDSPEGLAFGEHVMELVQEESHAASAQLAEDRGVFLAWEGSRWGEEGRRMRNSYTTTIAPTGTISILADCSGGIEPLFSLVYERRIMEDEEGQPTILREVNPVFEEAAKEAGYWSEDLMSKVLERGSLQGLDEVPAEHQRLFVTARDISPEWHVRTQAAFQRHCDASISKTINFPHEATVEDVEELYRLAIDLEVKGLTVYRDGSREEQPMALKPAAAADASATEPAKTRQPESPVPVVDSHEVSQGELQPIRLPEIMSTLRIRQMTPFGNMHVKVSVNPRSGREREVFAQLGKGGDLANSDLEAICRLISLWLRAGGGLEAVEKQLSGIGSSLSVPTKDGRIMSLADGVAIALGRYMAAKRKYGLENLLLGRVDDEGWSESKPKSQAAAGLSAGANRFRVHCPSCQAELAFEEGCSTCHACGYSQC